MPSLSSQHWTIQRTYRMVCKMNVVIYARYSSARQTEQSIEGQLTVCHEFADRNGFSVVHEYIDLAMTGKTDGRTQFQKMIQDSEKKQLQGVLVYQFDRFSWSRYDSSVYKYALRKNGVKVFFSAGKHYG